MPKRRTYGKRRGNSRRGKRKRFSRTRSLSAPLFPSKFTTKHTFTSSGIFTQGTPGSVSMYWIRANNPFNPLTSAGEAQASGLSVVRPFYDKCEVKYCTATFRLRGEGAQHDPCYLFATRNDETWSSNPHSEQMKQLRNTSYTTVGTANGDHGWGSRKMGLSGTRMWADRDLADINNSIPVTNTLDLAPTKSYFFGFGVCALDLLSVASRVYDITINYYVTWSLPNQNKVLLDQGTNVVDDTSADNPQGAGPGGLPPAVP